MKGFNDAQRLQPKHIAEGFILPQIVTTSMNKTSSFTPKLKNSCKRRGRGVGGCSQQRGEDLEGRRLTVTPSGEERHPVDGDGDGAVLVVEVVDMVRGAQAGGHASRSRLDGEQSEQGEPEHQLGVVAQAHAQAELGAAAAPSEHGTGREEPPHVRQVHGGPERDAARPSRGL